jgi:DNA modification methylase
MKNKEKRVHPAQKPVPLMKWCMGFAKGAQTILDPWAGSGSTLVAAKELGLYAVGVEADEHYCRIAAERLAACRANKGVTGKSA